MLAYMHASKDKTWLLHQEAELQYIYRENHKYTKVNFIIPFVMETEMQNTGLNLRITIM